MPSGAILPDGQRVKALRAERGWTQEELAGKVGCAKKTIENIEAGRPVLPRTLRELAQALGVAFHELCLPKEAPGQSSACGPATEAADGVEGPPQTVFRVIVELDLSRYSDIARHLEQSLGVAAVAALNDQIQALVRQALTDIGQRPEDALVLTTGDGAILAFEQAATASRFAEELHRAAEAANCGKDVGLARRHFRIGVSSDHIVMEPRTTPGSDFLGFKLAGSAVANAVRLEAACRTGEVLICSDTWAELPRETRRLYGPEEVVPGKRAERLRAHRRKVVEPAPWDGPEDSRLGSARMSAHTPPSAPKPPGSTGPSSGAELRLLLTEKLTLTDARQVWVDTLGEDLDEHMPGRGLPECVIELLLRARKRGRLPHLLDALRRVRPDLSEELDHFFP
jgi:transcriptional regulator with XRE-family HTH domain